MDAKVEESVVSAFNTDEPIGSFASRHSIELDMTDPHARMLCHEVLLQLPLPKLNWVFDVLCCRMANHANLFARFPDHMKVACTK